VQSVKAFNLHLYKFSQLKSINTTDSTIDNFFNALQRVLNTDTFVETKVNLTEKFIFQTKQERYPVLQVDKSGNKIVIYLTERYSEKLWICVTYTTQKNPDIIETRWLTSKQNSTVDYIHKFHWIIVNVKQFGKYESINLLRFYVHHINKSLHVILHI